jgi:hypothetical protein
MKGKGYESRAKSPLRIHRSNGNRNTEQRKYRLRAFARITSREHLAHG